MRSRDEIRDEVLRQLLNGPEPVASNPLHISREVDRRYHCERILEEAEALSNESRRVRVEFIAVPDDHLCAQCARLGGRSVTLEEFRRNAALFSCRCAVVLPEEEE